MKFLIYGEVIKPITLSRLSIKDLDTNKVYEVNIPQADEFEQGQTSFFIGETDEFDQFNVQVYDIRKFVSPLFEEDLMEQGSAPFHTKPTIIQEIIDANKNNGVVSLKVLTADINKSDDPG